MKFFIVILSVFCSFSSLSQELRKCEIIAGAGNYDGVFVGIKFYPQNQLSAGLSFGSNLTLFNQEEYYALNIFSEWNFKKKQNQEELSRWFISANVYNIYLEDKYYKWYFLAFYPGFGSFMSFSAKLRMSIDAGPVFPLVLYNKRKTFDMVGWPYHIQANLRVRIFLKL